MQGGGVDEHLHHDLEPSERASRPDGPSPSSSCHYARAASALRDADYLLILAGAGMSADSGLDTYEGMPERYRALCDPARLASEAVDGSADGGAEFQSFWRSFAERYANTEPHEGYAILDGWCHGGKLRRLSRKREGSDGSDEEENARWWVYTSNVDGHFRRFPSFRCRRPGEGEDRDDADATARSRCYDNVCEIHGRAGEFRCSCDAGYHGRERVPRMGDLWDRWNRLVESARPNERCGSRAETLEELAERDDDGAAAENETDNDRDRGGLPRCRDCRTLPLRPDVLLFHDTDENVLGPIRTRRDRYQEWEAMVESAASDPDVRAHLVLIEVGCGTSVPAVRNESEEVLGDTLDRLAREGEEDGGNGSDGGGDAAAGTQKGSVTLIRINPKDAGVGDARLASRVVSIPETALAALQGIDRALDSIL